MGGLVNAVIEGGQAHQSGVEEGMMIVQINGKKYHEKLLDECLSQRCVYTVTFKHHGANNHAKNFQKGVGCAERGTMPAASSTEPYNPDGSADLAQCPLGPGSGWKLIACISLDLCGNASYLLPEIGEATDIAWAPIQAVALRTMFDSNVLPLLGLAEELLPGTDIIPTATIAWCIEAFASQQQTPANHVSRTV